MRGAQAKYPRIPRTPFVLFRFPWNGGPSSDNIARCLCYEQARPLVIFVTRRPVCLHIDPRFDQVQTVIPKALIPDGPCFTEFKMYVYNCLKMFPNAMIGIATAKGNQMALYMVVRWLIEEKCVALNDALEIVNKAEMPLTKKVYLDSLNEIYVRDYSAAPMYDHAAPQYSIGVMPMPSDSMFPLPVDADSRMLKRSESLFVDCVTDRDVPMEDIGVGVLLSEAEKVRNEIYLLLGLHKDELLIRPYYKFTRQTMDVLRNDDKNLYYVLPEPCGYRCILYVCGRRKYLVDNENMVREVKVYLPQYENRDQNVMSAIIEGVMMRVSGSSRCKFLITDIYKLDGEDMRGATFDARMACVHDNVVRPRQTQKQRNMFTSMFENDDFDVDLRKYLRLKYLPYIFENLEQYEYVKFSGVLFVSRGKPQNNMTKFYLWTGTFPDYLHVRVKVDNRANRVFGMARDEPEDVPIFDFGQSSSAWDSVNDKIVAVGRSDDKWVLIGMSHKKREMARRECEHACQNTNSLVYPQHELCEDANEIIKMDIYVQEEKLRSQAKR